MSKETEKVILLPLPKEYIAVPEYFEDAEKTINEKIRNLRKEGYVINAVNVSLKEDGVAVFLISREATK